MAGKYCVELKSDIDTDTFFFVQTLALKQKIENENRNKAVYLPYETPLLSKMSKEMLIKIHLLKKSFNGIILSCEKKVTNDE